MPVGVLFGLAASGRLVRRVRRLERATLAVADGDYTVDLPASGRDEVGRLEANFNVMTRQLGSALAAQRQRAAGDARAAERARIAREMHDAISQHLFALRMIASGLRRADPGNEQAAVIERISFEALRDMQALLVELRPAGLDGAGLAPALRELCANYHDRLGVGVGVSVDDVTVPAPVEHALLRVAQEACANAVRHGDARKLAVSLTRAAGHVELTVRDEGAGTPSLSPELLTRLTQAPRRPAPPDPLAPLSPREREVLGLIARGRSNRQIARDLLIGEQTVKTHVRAILAKLGLQDRVQAAIFALRHQAGGGDPRPLPAAKAGRRLAGLVEGHPATDRQDHGDGREPG